MLRIPSCLCSFDDGLLQICSLARDDLILLFEELMLGPELSLVQFMQARGEVILLGLEPLVEVSKFAVPVAADLCPVSLLKLVDGFEQPLPSLFAYHGDPAEIVGAQLLRLAACL